ncbi:MAG: DsbC family protein [Deltaproteobacteria bacterium]|nr:DsbC family protein [Deltaproteobacteria bacterium]
MKRLAALALGISAFLLLCASGASAFQKEGCGMGDCRDCHTLTPKEASGILGPLVDNVLNVEDSPVKGLWMVDIEKQGKKFPIFIDYSKGFLFSGQVVRISTREDISGARFATLNAVKVDPAVIPLGETLVLGNPEAKKKVIVFSDPDCHFCGKLHHEMKTVAEKDKDVAFFIKLYSRNNNPASAEKAKAVICSKSLSMLEDAYAGKKLAPGDCKTDAVEESFKLAEKLKIRGTPAMVFPDGTVVSGYRPADALLKLLSDDKPKAASAPAKEGKKGKK